MKRLLFPFSLGFLSFSACMTPTVQQKATGDSVRRLAAESMVLLKNDGTLPLAPHASVDLVGDAYVSCGGGSAVIRPPYVVDLARGLAAAGVRIEKGARTVVWNIARTSGEGRDNIGEGRFTLTSDELNTFAALKASGRRVVAVLNVGTLLSLAPIQDDPALAAVVYISFPGMEGGHAVADVLTGRVNPSGRLCATIAARVEDYPSDATWQEARHYVAYEDDVYVGYRYFGTIPGASEKVVYPFGYGLSYTTFACADTQITVEGDGAQRCVATSVVVKNTGRHPGRHSVLVYIGRAGGMRELKGFAKTRLLQPGESETLRVAIPVASLAHFEDAGPDAGSWVLAGDTYVVYVGGDALSVPPIRLLSFERCVVSTPGFKLEGSRLARRMQADGTQVGASALYGRADGAPSHGGDWPRKDPWCPIRFDDVAAGRATVDDFLAQMPIETLVKLLYGQKNLKPHTNVGSIGYLPEYGVPGVQTADGPVGVRLTRCATTLLPATALMACSFDEALMEEYGRILGGEASAHGVDVLLAPGINIARHPLCGRNFEYMGEDPLLAGKMAAAYVRGVQSKGVAATLKHFAANNRENGRRETNSIVSERAMREIYLKGFEIAVKEGRPKCVMTSYNSLNGVATSAHYGLIEGILRGEWGFEGLVMSDWAARSHLWQNVAAGNDVKMPNASSESLGEESSENAVKSFCVLARGGYIDRAMILASARRVIALNLACHASGRE